jgi:hypothetical protein
MRVAAASARQAIFGPLYLLALVAFFSRVSLRFQGLFFPSGRESASGRSGADKRPVGGGGGRLLGVVVRRSMAERPGREEKGRRRRLFSEPVPASCVLGHGDTKGIGLGIRILGKGGRALTKYPQ